MRAIHLSPGANGALLREDPGHPDLAAVGSELLSCRDWRDRGVALVNGVPVSDEPVARAAVRTFSRAIGTLLPQDGAGQLVREVRYRGVAVGEGATGRYSDSREGGQLHTDGPHRPGNPPQVFALLCVRQSRAGGALVLVQANRIIDELSPHEVVLLQQHFLFDQREQGSRPIPRPVLRRGANGQWFFTYLRAYVDLGHAHHSGTALSRAQREVLDRLDATLERLAADPAGHQRLKLEPGQLAVVDNRRLLHGRTTFGDDTHDRDRLLLRTWIEPGDDA